LTSSDSIPRRATRQGAADAASEPTGSRPYHHGSLREALLEAGLMLLREKGPHDFSMRELAERVSVTRTAPAHHFQDKNGLLAALVTQGYRKLVDRRLEALQGLRADAREKMIVSALAYVRFALDEPALFSLMFSTIIKDRDRYADLVVAQRTAYYMLDDFMSELGLRYRSPDTEPVFAYGLWSLMHGISTLKINQPGAPSTIAKHSTERLVRDLVGTFLDGIVADAQPISPAAGSAPSKAHGSDHGSGI
jgi:AcrR family transcriptional regulator